MHQCSHSSIMAFVHSLRRSSSGVVRWHQGCLTFRRQIASMWGKSCLMYCCTWYVLPVCCGTTAFVCANVRQSLSCHGELAAISSPIRLSYTGTHNKSFLLCVVLLQVRLSDVCGVDLGAAVQSKIEVSQGASLIHAHRLNPHGGSDSVQLYMHVTETYMPCAGQRAQIPCGSVPRQCSKVHRVPGCSASGSQQQ